MDNTNLQDPVIESASKKEKVSKTETGYLPPVTIDQKTVSQSQKNNWHWFQVYTACIIKLILSIIAGSLVWQCNAKENILVKIVFTVLAVMFSEIYILYYAIYRTYMGNKCPV